MESQVRTLRYYFAENRDRATDFPNNWAAKPAIEQRRKGMEVVKKMVYYPTS